MRQYDPRYDSAPGCHLGDRALLFDPDSDPEQEISVWTEQHQGENTFEYPYRTAPNGRFSAEKTPWPILLSSRSGVRVPSGVPLLSPVFAGLEQLNATRVSVAREGLTERHLD